MAIAMIHSIIDPLITNICTAPPPSVGRRMAGCKRRLPVAPQSEHEQSMPMKKARVTPPPKKTVRFNGAVSVHVVSRVDDIDAPYVWHSNEEFLHARHCDAHYIRFYNHCDDDQYKEQLFRVLGAACGKLSVSESASACVALAESPARGLEREMTPCFRLRKKQVVANVLQSQSALRNYCNDEDTTEKDAANAPTVLAAHYHKLALPATRFARLLAQGDARLVANMD